MSEDPIAPDFTEVHTRAKFHLEEAVRILTARYPWWAGKRPDGVQRGAMRRAARHTRLALKHLNLPTTVPDEPGPNPH